MTSTTHTIGGVIGPALNRAGLSNLDVADATGLTLKALRQRLEGERAFTVGELDRIANLIGVPLSALVAQVEQP